MPFVYTRPLNRYEQAVRDAGYLWVSTGHLTPYGTPWVQGTDNIPDRLNPHFHGSFNTHLIVYGQADVAPVNQHGHVIAEWSRLDAHTKNSRTKELAVEPGVSYRGTSRTIGCEFVEGHSILSPSSAKRFEERHGSIKWVDDGSGMTRQQWFDKERADGAARQRPHAVNQAGLYPARQSRKAK